MSEVLGILKDAKKHILAGVSYLIPVVVVGGICCGLGVAFGGTAPWEAPGTAGYFFFILGKYGLNLMPAVIAAYVAYSIADKVGIGPGLIIGQVAQDSGAGFIGGIIAGFFVGICAYLMKKVKIQKSFSALWSIIVIPLCVTVVGAFLMENVVAGVIVAFTNWLTDFFASLPTSAMALLGVVVGFFGSLDLGLFGNKALGAVPDAMWSTLDPNTGLPTMIAQHLRLIVSTTCAIPPLVCAFSTFIRPKLFNSEEREAGKAALFLGIFAITEGAIPLALADKTVYAGCIIGTIVGCVLVAIFPNLGTLVNWGGLPNLAGQTNVPLTLLCWAAGIAAGTAFVCLFKKPSPDNALTSNDAVAKVTEKGEEVDLDF